MFYYPKGGDAIDGELNTYLTALITDIPGASPPDNTVSPYSNKEDIKKTIDKYTEDKTAVIFSRFVGIKNSEIQAIFGNSKHIVFIISLNPYDICSSNIITYSNDIIAPAQCIYVIYNLIRHYVSCT